MATKDQLRDRLDELDAEQPPDDALHADLAQAVRDAEAASVSTRDDEPDNVHRTDPEPDSEPEPGYASDDDGTVPDDHAARDADGDLCPFYCPGCGRGLKYEGECTGTPTAPHAAIQTVSTDELSGAPENHTPAPGSD